MNNQEDRRTLEPLLHHVAIRSLLFPQEWEDVRDDQGTATWPGTQHQHRATTNRGIP